LIKNIYNDYSYIGWSSRNEIINEIKYRKYNKALLITDETLSNLGLIDKVVDLLKKNKIDYMLFDEVKSNPTVNVVKKGLRLCNKYHMDYIIAFGGGSAIDAAKAISVSYSNPKYKEISNMDGELMLDKEVLPIIAIPTTFSCMDEASNSFSIFDENRKEKIVGICDNKSNIVSIIDGELMAMMPANLLATSGISSLFINIDNYLVQDVNIFADMYIKRAISLIYNNVEGAINREKESIENMAISEYISGLALSSTGVGLIQYMAHQLEVYYDIPYSLAIIALFPSVMQYKGSKNLDKVKEIVDTLKIDNANLTGVDLLKRLSIAINNLLDRIGLKVTISSLGGKFDDIEDMAKKVVSRYKDISLEDVKGLYKDAF